MKKVKWVTRVGYTNISNNCSGATLRNIQTVVNGIVDVDGKDIGLLVSL